MATIEMEKERQLTDTVVMVKPSYFGYNDQTAQNNSFQRVPTQTEIEVRHQATQEFGTMVETLTRYGLRVVLLDSPLGSQGEITPDAIFPNNWFSTHDNALVLYPMWANNRRHERQPEALKRKLAGLGILYPQTIDLTKDEEVGQILEGTGSLVLDRENKIAYAIESQRTNEYELRKWSSIMGYSPVFFHAVDLRGKPVYHTNVIMSVGEDFAVVCMQAIGSPQEREVVTRRLEDTGNKIVDISVEQMYEMCGNILQTKNDQRENLIIMSERARKGFSYDQSRTLEQNGTIVPVKIDTIETVGGGSARCMIAETFY